MINDLRLVLNFIIKLFNFVIKILINFPFNCLELTLAI